MQNGRYASMKGTQAFYLKCESETIISNINAAVCCKKYKKTTTRNQQQKQQQKTKQQKTFPFLYQST